MNKLVLGPGDTPPEVTPEQELALDEVWAEIGKELKQETTQKAQSDSWTGTKLAR